MSESFEVSSSMRAFYILLSGSIQLKSQTLLRDEFNDCKAALLKGICRLNRFDTLKTKSHDSLKAERFRGIPTQILFELSTLLDLDPEDAYSLFQSYILYEFKGTPHMIKLCFSNDNNLKSFFEKMLEYYHHEKMFTIFSIKLILATTVNARQAAHPSQELMKEFANEIRPNIFESLLKQLNHLERTKLLTKHPMMSDRFRQNCVEFKHNELAELLQVTLLYLHDLPEFSEKVSNDVLKYFQDTQESDRNAVVNEMSQFIAFLKSLVLIACLKPELSLISSTEHPILRTTNRVFKDKFQSALFALDMRMLENSFASLYWLALCYEEIDEGQIMTLLQKACSSDIWIWLDYCLKLPQMDALSNSKLHNIIVTSVGHILSLFFHTVQFNDDLILKDKTIESLFSTLFQYDSIAEMFKNDVCGFHKVFIAALSYFPVEYCSIVRWIEALTKTKFSSDLFLKRGFCNSVDFYCELYDEESLSYRLLEDGITVVLTQRRTLNAGNDIFAVLDQNCSGQVVNLNDTRIVKWTLLYSRIDFWLLCYKIANDIIATNGLKLFEDNSRLPVLQDFNSLMSIGREFICKEANSADSSVSKLVNLMIHTFQSISPKIKNAKFLTISVLKLSDLFVRGRLKQPMLSLLIKHEVLPTMLLSSCNLAHILNGGDVHNGSVGYLLGMDESLNGEYGLLKEYLSFILSLLKSGKYPEICLPSIVFILRDIFGRYRFWNYRNACDRTLIGKQCLEIFYQLLKFRQSGTLKSSTTIIHHICVIMLMEGNCAETLLHMLVDGEQEVVKNVLLTGNESLFRKNASILSVRLVLKLISKLLEIYPEIKNITGHSNRSVIEENLFASSVHNRDNILKMITNLVYQKLDINLCRTAMFLLEQLSKQFPMTLLPCLGRNAKFMCDNFLRRLDSFTEDIQMKISFLNFFGICLDFQPGLAEMFLSSKMNDSQLHDSTDCPDILNTILIILKEKKGGQFYCPFELHLTSLQFLSKLFAQPNFVAINVLKDSDNFWELLTFPLLNIGGVDGGANASGQMGGDTFEVSSKNSIIAPILKIIARYMHLVENKVFPVDSSFDKLIGNIVNEERIESIKVRIDQIVECCIADEQIESGSDELIHAWRDFLAIRILTGNAKITPSLLESTIANLIKIAQSPYDHSSINSMLVKYSTLFLLVCKNYPETERFTDSGRQIPELMKRLTDKSDSVSLNVHIYCHSGITQLLLRNDRPKSAQEIHQLCTDLLYTVLIKFKDQLKVAGFEKYSKWPENNRKFVDSNMDAIIDLFLSTLKRSGNEEMITKLCLQDLIMELLNNLIEDKSYNMVNILFKILIGMSFTRGTFGSLLNVSIIEQITLHFPLDTIDIQQRDEQYDNRWKIITSILIIMNNMCLKSRFISIRPAINFIAVQLSFCKKIVRLFCMEKEYRIGMTILAFARLSTTLLSFRETWTKEHMKSFEEITGMMLNLANFCISSIISPVGLTALSEEKFEDLILPILTETLSYVDTLIGEYINNDDDFEIIENKCLKLTSADGAGQRRLPSKGSEDAFIISLNMTKPNIDLFEDSLSFGGLIHYIIHALKSLFSIDEAYASKEDATEHQRLKKRISRVVPSMEIAIMIMLKETSVLKGMTFDDSHKNQLYTEILNEVNNFRNVINTKLNSRRSGSFTNLRTPVRTFQELLPLGKNSFTIRLFDCFERSDESRLKN